MNHSITLEQAKQMTALYRKERENILVDQFKGRDILAICETFDAAAFHFMLGQPDCKSLRIYFGMGTDLKVHAIIVGVNSKNEDILPTVQSSASSTSSTTDDDDDGPINEEGLRCPPECPPPSPLNTP